MNDFYSLQILFHNKFINCFYYCWLILDLFLYVYVFKTTNNAFSLIIYFLHNVSMLCFINLSANDKGNFFLTEFKVFYKQRLISTFIIMYRFILFYFLRVIRMKNF